MLGKTANGLFWLSRYMERAENTARLAETGQRLALTSLSHSDSEWASVLESAGTLGAYTAIHGEVTPEGAMNWMLRDKANPSSVLSCIEAARQNARLVRTAITGEVWSAINATYMASRQTLARRVPERDLPNVLRDIRQSTALVRGMIHGTMLRNDIYDFLRLGTFLERADNTARILDVKYYVLLPSVSAVGSSLDNVQWESILRSVSARGGFRMEYGASAGPRDIAHFLVLDERMPRSLAFCAGKIESNLDYLAREIPANTTALEAVRALRAGHLSRNVDDIFDFGLHEFIQDLLRELSAISARIEVDYRFYE